MPRITVNPTISYEPHFVQQFYFEDGTAIFPCVGDPDGVVAANMRSFALSDDGNTYYKTVDDVAGDKTLGWVANGGGGGTGTVTSVALSMPSIFGVAGSPITTAGTLTVTLSDQSANTFLAGPASGPAATPGFRAIATADLSGVAIAATPANANQYNNGTNGFAGSVNWLFDPATATAQLGSAAGITGKIQLRSSVSGSITHSVDNPAGNYTYIWPNALPATNDLLTVSVSGSTVTLSGVARSTVSGPTINATDTVIPYRSSATAFSDSPIRRLSATAVGFGTAGTDVCYTQGIAGVFGIGTGSSPVTSAPVESSGYYCNQFNNQTASITCSLERLVGLSLGSNLIVGWQSAASGGPSPTLDVSIARRQAGYVRVANGSTGIGGLLVGGSSATPIGQTHLINGAVGVEPLYLEAIASTSVPTVRGVQSSIQSFALNPSGKLQGGLNIPTASQQFSARGNLKSDVSSLGNIGTGQDNLLSFAVPANTIVNTGDTVEFITTIEFAANANNKEVEILFGGVSIFLVSDLFSGSFAQIVTRIKRTGATTAKVIATWTSSDVLLRADCQYNDSAAITWANANTFQVQGEATATDDIINRELESNVIVAQAS